MKYLEIIYSFIILLFGIETTAQQYYSSLILERSPDNVFNISDSIRQDFYKLDSINFVSIEYDQNGCMLSEGLLRDGEYNGLLFNYAPCGELKSSVVYKNGCESGQYIEFYPSGRMKTIGNYEAIYPLSDSDSLFIDYVNYPNCTVQIWHPCRCWKDGYWFFYTEQGTLQTVKHYQKGVTLQNE